MLTGSLFVNDTLVLYFSQGKKIVNVYFHADWAKLNIVLLGQQGLIFTVFLLTKKGFFV